MTSKERVTAAIARQPVDRVPLGFYAVDHDVVEQVIGRPTFVRNKIDLRIALSEGRRDEVAESLKKDTVEFYRRIDCADLLLPKEAQLLPPEDYEPEPLKKIGDDQWEDSRGRVLQAVRHANEIGCVYDPAANEPPPEYSLDDFAAPVTVSPPDPSVFEVFDYVYSELGEERYIASPCGGVTAMTLLGGTENGLVMYALQPDVVAAANRQSADRQNQLDEYFVRNNAPGVMMEQDMAGTNGPLISPAMFKDLCLPFLKERIANVKKYAPQVIFHNCGQNMPLMDMFIDAGVDCYQSLQTTAGMEIGKLKELYGASLCFWGGVPVEMLIDGSPQDVRAAVRTAMERGAPGGGFILGPSHSIAKNTTYDNFMALIDEHSRLCDKY